MDRYHFQRLAGLRLQEARVLLRNGKFEGCYYLSGYAVECALKACICKLTRRYDFPDRDFARAVYVHNLTDLLRLAKLEQAMTEDAARNREFRLNWAIVRRWNEESRYGTPSQRDADEMFQAVSNRSAGVVRWLRRHW